MVKKILTLAITFVLASVTAQETIVRPNFLKYSMDSITKVNFAKSLESLFLGISQDKIDEDLLTPNKMELTKSQLKELVKYELEKDSARIKIEDKYLINIYPISANKYYFSLAYINEKHHPNLQFYTINLVATKTNDKFTFSIPIDYLTRYWKTEVIGNITYHFRKKINRERAKLFDKKNTLIANKLGVKPEKLDFYMCDNFQEISELLGFGYSVSSNGKYRDGYGVDVKTIFSIMNNEDFSHDIFHYYSGQINERIKRNWITEEGIAYAWGNAYYTDKEGEMITHTRLVRELKKYLLTNPNTDLYGLFSNNPKIFKDIAPEVSVRSIISGIIANEIEKKKGMKGILKLINTGRKQMLDSYLKVTNEYIGINKENFNSKVGRLILNN